MFHLQCDDLRLPAHMPRFPRSVVVVRWQRVDSQQRRRAKAVAVPVIVVVFTQGVLRCCLENPVNNYAGRFLHRADDWLAGN